jgi:hypothetical protein
LQINKGKYILPQVKQAVGVSTMKKKSLKRPKRRIPLPKKTEKVHDEKVGYRRKPKHRPKDTEEIQIISIPVFPSIIKGTVVISHKLDFSQRL